MTQRNRANIGVTREYHRVLTRANKKAAELGSGWLLPLHLLYGLVANENNQAARAIAEQRSLGFVLMFTEMFCSRGPRRIDLDVPPVTQRVFDKARDEALVFGQEQVNPGHLLLALTEDPKSQVTQMLEILRVDVKQLRRRIFSQQR